MKRAAIYARYSSDMQREESAEAQIEYCQDYAQRNGYEIIKIYVDKAKSAKGDKISKRVEFHQMITDSSFGLFDVVLIHKYNRFARSMKDHVVYEDKLNQNGVTLIAVAEDFGAGKEAIIMKSLMRSLSEYYIADLADEVRKGHKINAEKALHNGGYAPFGYDIVNQQFVINEFEAGYVRKMFDCALKRTGFTELIKEMEKAGIKGKRGKLIKYPSIYEILRNERYTGTYVYAVKSDKHDRRAKKNAIRIENAIPAIITRKEWEEVQKIMNERKQTGRNSDYLCRGLVYCKECGAKMNGHISKKNLKSGETAEYRTYVCSKSCGVGTIDMDFVDDAVKEYIQELLSPQTQREIMRAIQLYGKSEKNRVEAFNEAIKQKIKEKQNQYDGLMDTLAQGGLPSPIISDIGKKMEILLKEISALNEQKPPKDYTTETIMNWLNSIKNSPDSKVVHLLVEKILVNKKEVNVESTLTSLLGHSPELGGDTPIHIFPTILFMYTKIIK